MRERGSGRVRGGGVSGVRRPAEDSDAVGETAPGESALALAKVVAVEGAESAASCSLWSSSFNEITFVDAGAASASSVDVGECAAELVDAREGWLSDHGDLSGSGEGAARWRRFLDGEGGTDGAAGVTSAKVIVSSNHCAFLAGAGNDCLEGRPDIGPARKDGCMLFVGRGGS